MTLMSKYPKDFRKLIYSGSMDNIADSLYGVAFLLGLVKIYHIKAESLSLFVLVGMLPSLLAFLYSPFLAKIKRTKEWLLFFRGLYFVVAFLVMLSFYWHVSVGYLYLYNLLFSLLASLQAALQTRLVPEILQNKNELIERSVDIQYFTGNTLDILSNFVASLLLGIMSYLAVIQLSFPFFVLAFLFILKLEGVGQKQNDQFEKLPPLKSLLVSSKLFFQRKSASQIIMIEAFLSGALDLLSTLAPLYLVSLKVDLKWLGVILALQRAADFTGALLAPYVSIEHKRFFCIDYIFSGTAFLLIFIIPQFYIKLILLYLGFVLVGISGNIFEKMIYQEYTQLDFSVVSTLVTSLYSFFGVLFLLVPQFYSNIVGLGLVLNSLTILFGIIIFFQGKKA